MTPITRADLEANGMTVGADGVVRKVAVLTRAAEASPEVPSTEDTPEYLVGIDPSVRKTGLALVGLSGRMASTKTLEIARRRDAGEDDEAFLTRRLRGLAAGVAQFVNGVPVGARLTCLVESAKIMEQGKVDPLAIVKLGMAVGSALTAVPQRASCVARLVAPSWTWKVLCHRRKGGADKRERWVEAVRVLEAQGIPWPLAEPGAIGDKTTEEHQADALTLCAAWIVESSERQTGATQWRRHHEEERR